MPAKIETLASSTPAFLDVGKGNTFSISEVEPAEWDARVYDPEIAANERMLYKRLGYGALAQS